MDLLTVAQIAKALELPESTVRYYRDRFDTYVPAVGSGRRRRYRPEALEVLRTVADLLRSGIPADEVESVLADRFPMTLEPQGTAMAQQEQQQPAATQQQWTAIPQLAAIVEARIDQAIRSALNGHMSALEAQVVTLQTKVEQLTAMIEQQAQAAAVRDADILAGLLQLPRTDAPESPAVSQQTADGPGAVLEHSRPWWRWW